MSILNRLSFQSGNRWQWPSRRLFLCKKLRQCRSLTPQHRQPDCRSHSKRGG